MVMVEDDKACSCLPHRSEVMCTSAVSVLEDICKNIYNGGITVRDMEMILQRKDQMEKLCSALVSGHLNKQGAEYERIKEAIETRIKELRAFKVHKDLLGSLCQGVTVTVSGMPIVIILIVYINANHILVVLNSRP